MCCSLQGCSLAALTSAKFRISSKILTDCCCLSAPATQANKQHRLSMCGPSHSHVAPACRSPTHSKHHGEHCAVGAERFNSQAYLLTD